MLSVGGTMNMVNVLKGSKLNVVIVGESIVLRIRDVKHTKKLHTLKQSKKVTLKQGIV